MTIEENIFKRHVLNREKLVPYGFERDGGCYFYKKAFKDVPFLAEIKIDDAGNVSGRVIDTEFGEEYTNYRVENASGGFILGVKREYEEILLDIRKNCFTKNYFIFPQSNRMCGYMAGKYGSAPEFLFDKYPGFGVFRNAANEKWYGLIMDIPFNKVDKSSVDTRTVEIINLKTDKDNVPDLLLRKGIFEAYHMNKKSWISVLTDDTLQDSEIEALIDRSFELS